MHWRTQLTVTAGLAVAAIVLTGSLIVGDSVLHSLRQTALQRIGATHFALLGGERFFMASLADRMAEALNAPSAPVMHLNGTASHPETQQRANAVQVLGVDARFWDLSASGERPSNADRALVNERLARQLDLKDGDTIVLRIDKPSAIPKDALMSSEEDATVALRIAIANSAAHETFGRFSLRADQASPYTVFVPLETLQETVDLPARANLVLVGEAEGDALTSATVEAAVDAIWTLNDAQLELQEAPEVKQFDLRSHRVFLAPHVVAAATAADDDALPVLTYFVNSIRSGTNATPYSMISAVPPRTFADQDLGADDILINTWLAQDLGASAGDALTLRYYVMGEKRRLEEREHDFTVAAIIPMTGLAGDATLMPDLPGISDSENCREWEPGFPIALDQIRDQDETYWDDHKGTPKAFIALATGQTLWQNRYGSLTSVRYPSDSHQQADLANTISSAMRPARLGVHVAAVREQALHASADAMNFGELFISFSFFLVVAALLLSAMLFAFNVDSRRRESGLLRATGFTAKALRNQFLREGLIQATLAVALGLLLGTQYTRILLHQLKTTWRQTVGDAVLVYHAEPTSLAIAAVASVGVALITIWIVLKRQGRLTPTALLKDVTTEQRTRVRKRRVPAIALPCLLSLAAVALTYLASSAPAAEQGPRFFGAGMLLLVAILWFCHVGLRRLARHVSIQTLSLPVLCVRGLARQTRRSLATLALLATGTFMVFAVSAHRLDATLDSGSRESGTGGYAYVAQLTTPVLRDLNDATVQASIGIAPPSGAIYTQVRVAEGDETSCLNLNRPQQPRLWGIDPDQLRGRFTFLSIHSEIKKNHKDIMQTPWSMLMLDLGPNRVPVIGDNNSILYSLGKKLGDTISMVDANGETYELVIVGGLKNSMLQGGFV
ncbi:MAG: FtsX-like permease family protein, partial [Kiritimatiellae bacterium]|nr:FtsX-like permease family protein [Kiritimatiellia bacterium]